MSFWKVIGKRSVRTGLKAYSSILLLLLYLVGNTQIESIHKLFHSHSNSLNHSVEQEKDPCHRTIYHQVKKDGCEHNSHLVKVQKCSLCQVLFHSDQIVFSDLPSKPLQSGFILIKRFIPVQLAGIDDNLPARAPPFI
jgi:hypothetical protein